MSLEVRRVAKLARIYVTDEEVDMYQIELEKVVSWIDQMSEVNTDSVEPLVMIGVREMPLREDVVTEGPEIGFLVNAPKHFKQMFVVPKVVE
jgi:aspartyl-tRNA(Asn)/glutamyl-tRNA(Gln) amidotransferase subunit C